MSDAAHKQPPDVLSWARRYLPHYFAAPSAPFHAELLNSIVAPERRLIARVAPRGHAKSTCAALAYPLWCICTQQRRNIVIVTHEASLATQFVRDLRAELEGNEALRAEYGDLCTPDAAAPDAQPRPRSRRGRPTRWTATTFTTNTGVTVQAKGTGASFRGTRVGPHRPDLVICDDIEKDELVASVEQRAKLEHWLRRVVMPALAPEGQLLVLGSIIHHDGLLARLAERQRWPRWDYRVYRALEARVRPDGGWERVALWPARWPVARLDQERERIGTLAFEQEYQANPIDDSIRVFRPDWLKRYDPQDLAERQLVMLMAVDPATGVTGGDYFALWIGGVDPRTGVIYTLRLTVERLNVVAQIDAVVAAFQEFRPVRIGIETVAYQVALKQILEEESRKRRLYMPIVALPSQGNKRARIEGASVLFERGLFLLPPTLDAEVERQFLEFPKSRHDDAPDVCAMGIELARSFRSAGPIAGGTRSRRNGAVGRRDGW